MRNHEHTKLLLALGAVILLAACGREDGTARRDAAKQSDCRMIPPAELSPSLHGCALAAEMRAVAEALSTVTDQQSTDSTAVLLRRSGERLRALRTERLKLNDDPKAGAKGALVGMHTPAMSAASRAIIDETIRISKEAPHLMQTISPAMEALEL